MLCCGVLTLLGDAAPALALPEVVRADGVELLLQLMHPRWEERQAGQESQQPGNPCDNVLTTVRHICSRL